MTKYLIRLDDACETMRREKWHKIFDLLDQYSIKPIVAVIPANRDPNMFFDEADRDFWVQVKEWEKKGYYIAMHGYDHSYISQARGLVPMNDRSEFAGVDFEGQKEKIRKAWKIFKQHNIIPKIWVAPAHTFDENTLKALKEETTIRVISDGIGYYPYTWADFVWIPQQLWWYPKKERPGIWTICLHPNNMSDKQIDVFGNLLDRYAQQIIKEDLWEIVELYKFRRKSLKENLYEKLFFAKRHLLQSKISQNILLKLYR